MALCYFPAEIISEILLRLGVKSLVRFTCVSKSWCSIISNNSFAFAHLSPTNRSHNNHIDDRLLLVTISCKTNDHHRYVTTVITAWFGKQVIEEQEQSTKSFNEHKELKFKHRSLKHFDLVGCNNGLVLIKLDVDTLLLWNPLLQKFETLPKPDNIGYEEKLQVFSIGWGFGFDSRTNDYKAVKIVCLENNGEAKLDSLVQVFSLATRCWKSIRVGVPACSLNHRGLPSILINGPIDRIINRRPQPFINGAVHWLASRIDSDVRRYFVLSFDISNEIFREIMLPDKIALLSSLCLFISVYEKSLAAYVASPYLRSLWVMKEYGVIESWTQVLIEQNMPKPLGFTTRGEVLWQPNNGEVASYDPKSPKIMNRSVDDKGAYCFAGPYEESLALLYEANLSRKRRGKKGNTIGTKQERAIDFLEHAKKSEKEEQNKRRVQGLRFLS